MPQIESHIDSTNAEAVIRSIIQAVYQSLDIDEVFQEIVRTLGIYLQADRCFITRFDENTGVLSAPTKEYRSSEAVESLLNASVDLWKTLAELANGICKQDSPVEFEEIPELPPEVQMLLNRIYVKSGLASVIRYQDKCLAVLFIHQTNHNRHWTNFEKEIVNLTAIQSAVAIHHADLYETLQCRSKQREWISHLSQKAISAISLEELFTQVLEAMCKALNVNFGKIIEKTPDPEKPFLFRAVKGLNPQLVGQQFNAGNEPHANFTLKALEPIIVDNIYQEKRFKPSPLHFQYGFISGISAVIFGTGKPFGVLQADSPKIRNFSDEDVYLMQSFANISGLAIERKQVEIALEKYQKKLEQSNKELEQFATVASHDLRAPLRKISTFSNALQQVDGHLLSPEGTDYLKRINISAERMQHMINGLLALSSITRQAQPFKPVHLNNIVVEVLADLESYKREVCGSVEVSELCVIDGDESQLNQMLQNLISNALKFHRIGVPPVVKVDAQQLPNGHCAITVQDNGIGLEQEHSGRIFEVFERLHNSQAYEGSGIGLALVKRIVERHKGNVNVNSIPGEGTTFTVTLPIRQY